MVWEHGGFDHHADRVDAFAFGLGAIRGSRTQRCDTAWVDNESGVFQAVVVLRHDDRTQFSFRGWQKVSCDDDAENRGSGTGSC